MKTAHLENAKTAILKFNEELDSLEKVLKEVIYELYGDELKTYNYQTKEKQLEIWNAIEEQLKYELDGYDPTPLVERGASGFEVSYTVFEIERSFLL